MGEKGTCGLFGGFGCHCGVLGSAGFGISIYVWSWDIKKRCVDGTEKQE